MRTKRLFYIFILLAIWLTASACIEKFSPDIEDFNNQLVVDGLITDQEGPCQVKLSKTSPVEDPEYRPYENASVSVEDSDGNMFSFIETSPGLYQNNDLTGEWGVSYKLHITTPDGKKYESSFQEMPKSLPLDTVYAEIETQSTENPDYDEVGYQFYLSTHDPENEEMYFLWSLEETYEYNADHSLEFIFNGSFEPYPNPTEFSTCWKTNRLQEFFLFDATILNSVNLQNIPLNYVNTETKKLSVRYSLLVNQYVIPKETYDFYQSVQEMNSNNDLFYGTQPYPISGNIECIDDPDEKVLGMFWVAGKSSKRIFVTRPPDVYFYYEVCPVNTQGVPFIGNYHPSDWPIYLTLNDQGERGIVGLGCVDCREHGGSLKPPDFW